MNKRGYVFSVMAVLVIAVFLVVLSIQAEQSKRADTLPAHILSASGFVEQFEEDLPRAIRIVSYRSLVGLDDHISTQGAYIEDVGASFAEIAVNGTVNGTEYDVMDDSTLNDFLERMQVIADRVGLDLSLSINNISIDHTQAFEVEVVVDVGVYLQTRDERTFWNFTQPVSSEFRIDQLRDPLYTIGTQGRVPMVIREVNFSRPYIGPGNDTAKLQALYNQTLYHADRSAPSFLMRFSGNLSASEHGIASLVDTQVLDAQDLVAHTDRSVVDYLYFGASSTSTNQIINMPSRFVLDDAHLETYDAQGAVVS